MCYAVQIREAVVRGERQREEGRGVRDVLGADWRDTVHRYQVPHAPQAASAVVRGGLRWMRILLTTPLRPFYFPGFIINAFTLRKAFDD